MTTSLQTTNRPARPAHLADELKTAQCRIAELETRLDLLLADQSGELARLGSALAAALGLPEDQVNYNRRDLADAHTDALEAQLDQAVSNSRFWKKTAEQYCLKRDDLDGVNTRLEASLLSLGEDFTATQADLDRTLGQYFDDMDAIAAALARALGREKATVEFEALAGHVQELADERDAARVWSRAWKEAARFYRRVFIAGHIVIKKGSEAEAIWLDRKGPVAELEPAGADYLDLDDLEEVEP